MMGIIYTQRNLIFTTMYVDDLVFTNKTGKVVVDVRQFELIHYWATKYSEPQLQAARALHVATSRRQGTPAMLWHKKNCSNMTQEDKDKLDEQRRLQYEHLSGKCGALSGLRAALRS
jgi:hypothetical protein